MAETYIDHLIASARENANGWRELRLIEAISDARKLRIDRHLKLDEERRLFEIADR